MWRLTSNGSNDHDRCRLIHIIENTIFTDSQLPNRFHMFPWWNQAYKDLPVAGLSGGLVRQLLFDTIQDLFTLAGL